MGNAKDLSEDVSSAKQNLQHATSAISTITTSLSAAASTFAGVVDRIEERIKEIEIKEAGLKQLEEQLKSKHEVLEKKEKELCEKETNIEQREKIIASKEEKWNVIEQRVQSKVAQLPSLVNLNDIDAGGQRFTAPKEDLLRFKDSQFSSMLTSDNPQQLDTGEFYINDDPKVIRYILNFLRSGQLENTLECDPTVLEHTFASYKIPFPVFPFSVMFATNNNQENQNLSFLWQETIMAWLPNKSFNLLYRATRDGFKAEDFHRTCDNKGPTLTIVQSSEGFIFGGYSPIAWDSVSGSVYEPGAFLYTFTNPHGIPPTKYELGEGEDHEAICCSESNSVTFGSGYDFVVCNESNRPTSLSYSNFPRSYVDTTDKERATFTGSCQFTTRDVEVYSVS